MRARGAVEVGDQGQPDTGEDGKLEIEKQRGQEGHRHHRCFGATGAQDLADMVTVDQPPGHQHQHRCHGGIRQVGGKRCHQYDYAHQHYAGHHCRQWCLGACLVVEAAAVERTCRHVA